MSKHVILTSNAFFPNVGGIENSLFYLAKSYQKMGVEVDIIVSDARPIGYEELPGYEELEGVRVHRFKAYSRLPVISAIERLFRCYRLFKSLSNKSTVLVLSRFHTTTVIAKLAGMSNVSYLIPGVVSHQDAMSNVTQVGGLKKWFWQIRHKIHITCQNLAFYFADSLLVFSENMQRQIGQQSPSSSSMLKQVNPGVDCARFAKGTDAEKLALRAQLNLPEQSFILLGVGRLVKAKGFNYLIESLIFNSEAIAVILGDGPELRELEMLAKNTGVSERVFFQGQVNNTEAYFKASDCFMMTSIYEPFGQILLEALASGLPIVAFSKRVAPQTANEEILSTDVALFADSLNGKALAAQVDTLKNSPEIANKLAKNATDLAQGSYNWDTLAKHLLKGF